MAAVAAAEAVFKKWRSGRTRPSSLNIVEDGGSSGARKECSKEGTAGMRVEAIVAVFSKVEGRKDAGQSPLCLAKDESNGGAKTECGKEVGTAEMKDVKSDKW